VAFEWPDYNHNLSTTNDNSYEPSRQLTLASQLELPPNMNVSPISAPRLKYLSVLFSRDSWVRHHLRATLTARAQRSQPARFALNLELPLDPKRN